jgi:hypothetical protein
MVKLREVVVVVQKLKGFKKRKCRKVNANGQRRLWQKGQRLK